MMKSVRDENHVGGNGFTMMEMVIVLAIIGILASLGFKAFDNVLLNMKFESTMSEMKVIKIAIVGDPKTVQNNVRASFGFFPLSLRRW